MAGDQNGAIHSISLSGRGLKAVSADVLPLNTKSVVHLDLSDNVMTSLAGLHVFDKLNSLVLDRNSLTDLSDLPILYSLDTLSLNQNNISHLVRLMDALSLKCPNVTFLSLLKNPCCPFFDELNSEAYYCYRLYVIYRLPKLEFLDCSEVDEQERRKAMRTGANFAPVRTDSVSEKLPGYRPSSVSVDESNRVPNGPASPVSQAGGRPHARSHSGMFGMSQYQYDGSHSEGNRFISNKDL
eukprot:GILK01002905.1.p1 GENE.GILK01002905.1~~GILK01002905.1.p1  ORF type:complete len:240 (+),score=15.42 GILK01002905.1:66-785(+)